MGRWLFTFVAGVSLLICAATVFFHFHGASHRTRVGQSRQGQRMFNFSAEDGKLKVLSATPWPVSEGLSFSHRPRDSEEPEVNIFVDTSDYAERLSIGLSWGVGHVQLEDDGSLTLLAPGEWASGRASANLTWWALDVPYSTLILTSALLPGAWVLQRALNPVFRRRRRAAGRCERCGYDLRVCSGHCPECGAPATPAIST